MGEWALGIELARNRPDTDLALSERSHARHSDGFSGKKRRSEIVWDLKMAILLDRQKRLELILYLVSLHSLVVGLGLIFLPLSLMPYFGYQVMAEKFFPVQGGVFHIVMSIAYAMAGYWKLRQEGLIVLSIIAKFTATVFLIVYGVFVQPIWMVWLSALGDVVMGGVIFWAWRDCRRQSGQAGS